MLRTVALIFLERKDNTMRTFKSICKICHERKTNSPDQICFSCRRTMSPQTQLCKICGEIKTSSPEGICWRCWNQRGGKQLNDREALQRALERTKTTMIILKHRLDGLTYQEIANIVDLPVQTCYAIARNALKYSSKSKRENSDLQTPPSNSDKKGN